MRWWNTQTGQVIETEPRWRRTQPMTLFDYAESQRRKADGMEAAAEAQPTALALARGIARELARRDGETHADAVGRVLHQRHGITTLGPAAGSLFKGGGWEWTGKFVTSERKTNHGRLLRVWRLSPEG